MKGKLVRDFIPHLIEENEGKKPTTRTLSVSEFKEALLQKLVEEAIEASQEKNSRKLGMELADVEEVLETIRRTFGITKKEIALYRRKKKKERGAFSKKILLIKAKGYTP